MKVNAFEIAAIVFRTLPICSVFFFYFMSFMGHGYCGFQRCSRIPAILLRRSALGHLRLTFHYFVRILYISLLSFISITWSKKVSTIFLTASVIFSSCYTRLRSSWASLLILCVFISCSKSYVLSSQVRGVFLEVISDAFRMSDAFLPHVLSPTTGHPTYVPP